MITKQNSSFILTAFLACSVGGGACSSDPIDDSTKPGAVTVTALNTGGTYDNPLDSVPDSMANVVYFIATGSKGAGIFKVSGTTGAPEELFSGTPLVDPHGIEISGDDKTLFIADRKAGSNGLGGVLAMPVDATSAPTMIAGTESSGASALDVVSENGADQVYFVSDSVKCPCGVMKVASAGGTASTVFDGTGLTAPDGIAVSANGDIYIADRTTANASQILEVSGGMASKLLGGVTLGNPAGIALTLDGSTLLVSSINTDGSDQVVIIDTASGMSSIFNDVVGKNHNNSGGLHRASKVNVLSWCGTTGPYPSGQVYKVQL